MTYRVKIEYGVCGIHKENAIIVGDSIADLAAQINAKTTQVVNEIIDAEEQDGDLRQFGPCYGNGYMSTGGIEPTVNDDDILSAYIIDFTIDGVECDYGMKGYHNLKQATGLL